MVDISQIKQIIDNGTTQNVIGRALELRPKEIGSFISGLSNSNGGVILIGIELSNNKFNIIGLQNSFDIESIMHDVQVRLLPMPSFDYKSVCINKKNILAIQVNKSEIPVEYEGKCYTYQSNGVHEIQKEIFFQKPTVFISYVTSDTPIVDMVERSIRNSLGEKVIISRYTDLKYKESFKSFMNSIQDHDFILCFVSDSYLKSRACMYEVGEVIKDHKYDKKLLFCVLSENERKYYDKDFSQKIEAGIYDINNQSDYILYWKQQYDALEKKIATINDYEATRDLSKALNEIGNIYRNDIGEFMSFLADRNGLSFSRLLENNFMEITNRIHNLKRIS